MRYPTNGGQEEKAKWLRAREQEGDEPVENTHWIDYWVDASNDSNTAKKAGKLADEVNSYNMHLGAAEAYEKAAATHKRAYDAADKWATEGHPDYDLDPDFLPQQMRRHTKKIDLYNDLSVKYRAKAMELNQ